MSPSHRWQDPPLSLTFLKHQEGLKYVNSSGNHTGCQNSVRTATSSRPDWSQWFHGQRLYITTPRVPLAPRLLLQGHSCHSHRMLPSLEPLLVVFTAGTQLAGSHCSHSLVVLKLGWRWAHLCVEGLVNLCSHRGGPGNFAGFGCLMDAAESFTVKLQAELWVRAHVR